MPLLLDSVAMELILSGIRPNLHSTAGHTDVALPPAKKGGD